MTAIAALRRVRAGDLEYEQLRLWCPGCDRLHAVRVSGPEPQWEWDGNLDAPTISPSILVTMNTEPATVCHSFFKAGVWEFLGDCTHDLKGQHVPAVPLPDWLIDN